MNNYKYKQWPNCFPKIVKSNKDEIEWEDGIVYKKIHEVEVVDTVVKKQDTWVSVDDRLPEKSEWVIGFTISDGILFHIKQEEGEWCTMSTPWTGTKVTHWMPLPQPPTDRTNEEII